MKNQSFVFILWISVFVLSCKTDKDLDCSMIEGATFSSNAGRMSSILSSKCGDSTCHGQGGDGSVHWMYSIDYNAVQPHFEHMYEAAIEEGEMPPDTADALTQEEIEVFKCWKQAGFPE